MYESVQHILKDVAEEIWETRVYVGKKAARVTTYIDEKDNKDKDAQDGCWHKISKISLLDGEESFVIDLTAAQFGWQDGPIYPEHCYMDTRCELAGELDHEGALKLSFGATRDEIWKKDKYPCFTEGSRYLLLVLQTWERKHNKTVAELLLTPRKEFDCLVEEVIHQLESELDRFKEAWEQMWQDAMAKRKMDKLKQD